MDIDPYRQRNELLIAKGIKKYFISAGDSSFRAKNLVRAVDGIDLTIFRNESLGLAGESGSGKTTLGRVLLKLYPLEGGQLVFNGQDISQYSSEQMRPLRERMQMVFQDPMSSLDPRFNVRRIISEGLWFDKRLTIKEKDQRIRDVLANVGLPNESCEYFPHEFSGGERQRIAIARALIMKPEFLVLDEAVSSLDVLVQEQILNLFLELKERYRLTYLFISHNLKVLGKTCERIAVMYRGKIVEIGKTDDLFKNPLHPYTKNLLAAAMDYRVYHGREDFIFSEENQLVNVGNGHFVLQ